MRRIQVALLGDGGDLELVREAASMCARRGAVVLLENTETGAEAISAGEKIPNFRHISFEFPRKDKGAGKDLEVRVRHQTELQSLDAMCASCDGMIIIGDRPLAEAMMRDAGKPVVKPRKVGDCLEAVTDLMNRMVVVPFSETLRKR